MTAPLRVALDSAGLHALELSRQGERLRAELTRPPSDRRSALHEALRAHLRLRQGASEAAFAPGHDALTVEPAAGRLDVTLGQSNPLRVASVEAGPDGGLRLLDEPYALTPLETRFLADNGFPHLVPSGARSLRAAPVTDLHTHFSGCVLGPRLVEIGLEAGVAYPAWILAEAGIRVEAEADVPLRSLPSGLLALLASRLSIPLDRQTTFQQLEAIYRLRSPITRSAAAFVPLCRQIARDYQRMGARHVELSLGCSINAYRMRQLLPAMPAIEEETGVRLCFLDAYSRHDDPEWDMDQIALLKQHAANPLLVGVDFMGHETNSTRVFEGFLRDLAAWASRERPGFVIRVHAGENPCHPENVRVAVEAASAPGVEVRIGHGLYGVDDATLELLARSGAVVEFNLNSNFALNNIQTLAEAPIARYLARGIPVVLGTDGYGIYQTTTALEARTALLSGVDERGLGSILRTEAGYLERRRIHDEPSRRAAQGFVAPDDPPPVHFVPEVMERKRAAAQARDRALAARLDELGVPTLDERARAELFHGRRCISIAGAWARSWERVSEPQQRRVRDEIERLLGALPPDGVVLVTGGTRFGVEGVVQQAARRRGIAVLGALVRETPPSSLEPGAMTCAMLVGERLYDKAAGLYALVKAASGLALFIGGGPIVNDEIQVARNLRVPYLLMDGPEGASTHHARQQPERAFRGADEVLRVLSDLSRPAHEPFWFLGPNPTVDLVLTRDNPRTGLREVLLIVRDDDAAVEQAKWALPGGFQATAARRDQPWAPGHEGPEEACLREAHEETGIDLRELSASLLRVGVYQGGGRDPRDTRERWSVSTAFALHLPAAHASSPVAGGDDASDARWIPLDALPPLAFDHARILADALAALARGAGPR